VVCAASYEARPFGVRSAMPMTRAVKACPHLIVVRPRMGVYAEASRGFFAILDRYSPLVEGLSLDEAFVDVTGEERLFGDGRAIGERIKADVRRELGLVASVGVAPVKMAAKIASDLGKPDGLVVVDDVAQFLAPLPASRLWGVGEVTEAALRKIGITTIGEIARASASIVSPQLIALARGEDARHVEPDRAPVSIGHEDTFDEDRRDREELGIELLEQADRVCARAREHGYRARTVTIKVKYADHTIVTRRETLERPTADGRVVGPVAVRLLENVPLIERRGVRLTGVSLSNLVDRDAPRQLGFDDRAAEKSEKLGDTLDKIAEKFGRAAVKRAVHVEPDE
jgi:DNA polymerase-4